MQVRHRECSDLGCHLLGCVLALLFSSLYSSLEKHIRSLFCHSPNKLEMHLSYAETLCIMHLTLQILCEEGLTAELTALQAWKDCKVDRCLPAKYFYLQFRPGMLPPGVPPPGVSHAKMFSLKLFIFPSYNHYSVCASRIV